MPLRALEYRWMEPGKKRGPLKCRGGFPMHVAQVAPLTEAIPPRLYGGTERVVAWLIEELVALGHEVTLFASGDSKTSAKLESIILRAMRLSKPRPDPFPAYAAQLDAVADAATRQ